jgi:hypothetical protein
MKLVIDRSKWLRGEGQDESYLLRKKDGKMCCLGFYGLACGLTEEDILMKGTPEEVEVFWGPGSWLVSGIMDANELMSINDGRHRSAKERELKIAALFSKHGVEVEFIN